MKKLFIIELLASLFFVSCSDFLEIKPKDKIDADALFSDPEGVQLYMANLYAQLPIEDFYYMRDGFNGWIGENMVAAMFTDEATHSEYQNVLTPSDFLWWDPAFVLIRDINILSDAIPGLDITSREKTEMEGEVAFLKAYAYFGLVKRYGGVPIIDKSQSWDGDVDKLKVPRATEKDTWDYILAQCGAAVDKLPAVAATPRRANRYVAAALMSRIALHAASVAKFNDNMTLSGLAVDLGLVGVDKSFADGYYEKAVKAAETVIGSGQYGLYQPEPATPEEAAANYQNIFEDPNNVPQEAIFIKGYTKKDLGHNYEIYYGPSQTANGWPHPGRMNPNLELVDAYESYGSGGESTPVYTSDASDDLTDYNGFSSSKNYYKFDTPYEIFEGKDARLWATVILPGTEWKGETIVIQAGLIQQNGTPEILGGNPYVWPVDGKTYYPFGGADKSMYSGYDPTGGNYTRTGFSFKKFLNEDYVIEPSYDAATNDWIDIRYAEVLLNYIEAVYESNDTERMGQALEYLNMIRRRAGFTEKINALTSENIQRERLVELAFENKRIWDLIRRREFGKLRQNNQMHGLQPVLDLRGNEPKYIFIRSKITNLINYTFFDYLYYHAIPGTSANGLIQNPQY